jgi:RNA polymerase sigma-70 factor (ECF subfamily)
VEPSEQPGDAYSAAADATTEDAALAAACRAGDLRAYERFYALHGTRMKNLARNVLGSSADADDAVQETFLKVQRGISSFRGQSSFVTWTYRILINTCYDVRRSKLQERSRQR